MRMTRARSAIAIALVVLLASTAGVADEPERLTPTSPHVAGFDRFARHGEIEPILAAKLLVAELSCCACHSSSNSSLVAKGGPRLDSVAARITPAWLEQFIASPHSTKPGTTMPDVLGQRTESDRANIGRSIAAYLSTQAEPLPEVRGSGLLPVPHEFWNKGDATRGEQLYHRVGCVACHAANENYAVSNSPDSALERLLESLDPEELAERGLAGAMRKVNSVPLSNLTTKYTRRGLTSFLLDPSQVRPAGRMPALKLAPMESADIVAHLLNSQASTPEWKAATQTEIDQGRQHFVELKCVNCHSTSDLKPTQFSKPFSELEPKNAAHCLGSTALSKVDYHLDDAQTRAVSLALELPADEVTSAREQLQLQLLAFNCFACHERDGLGGIGRDRKAYFETVGNIDLGDEGRFPPPLTGVGRKLQTNWLRNVLQGKKADVRPHMHIRMPVFGAKSIAEIPEQLSKVDEAIDKSELGVFGDLKGLAEVGRQLMDVGCVQCHQFGGNALPGVVGVDVQRIATRIRPQWFHDFLLNPGAVKNRTRMPTFFPDGKSQRADLLHGDPERQIAAMWAYLKESGKLELPEKIIEAHSQNYELRPADRPVVLRTFMHTAGTHAIAVGFPQQVHYAFDAETLRLAVAWRGRFMDAQGTWFVRAAPLADPLGEAIVQVQNSALFALLSDSQQAWPKNAEPYRFKGYRLDKSGVPTLLYTFAGCEVEDRISPRASQPGNTVGLQRILSLRSANEANSSRKFWMLAASGDSLTAQSDHAFANSDGLVVTVANKESVAGLNGILRQSGGRSEWLIPIDVNDPQVIELKYTW